VPLYATHAHPDHDACGVGFVVQLGSCGSRDVVERALEALVRLSHRGGVDADGASGDGAGLLTSIPEKFIRGRALDAGIDLPEAFGLGMAFLPPEKETEACAAIEAAATKSGLRFLGWRDVPTDRRALGPCAVATLPIVRQCFIAPATKTANFERQLFFLRKRIEATAPAGTYLCSLSSRTVVYKGLLAPRQLPAFYLDLASPEFISPFAVFHQRYSTNTQPTWNLAQPFRFTAHNGEINTIGANRRWLRARERDIRRKFRVQKWFSAMEDHVSDSANFDNAFEILSQQGQSTASVLLQMVPPAWESDSQISPQLRAHLARLARAQEPWDGPAALVFSDGRMVGAKLDRNGLRPLRYTLTSDGLLVAGSEVGLTDFAGKSICERQRLGPGEMLMVDTATGAIFRGNELLEVLSASGEGSGLAAAPRLKPSTDGPAKQTPDVKRVAGALGWSGDQFRLLFQPLGLEGKEAVWSMGDDGPPAFLSSSQRPLWDYCKQRFAQVTNPPIDPLREAHVMSLDVSLGSEMSLGSPLLDEGQMSRLENDVLQPVFGIDLTFDACRGVKGALGALKRVRKEAFDLARAKPGMLVLSDRGVSPNRAALPALLALGAVWKEMLRANAHGVPLVIETGQVIETHHLALLVAAGATAVFPYLALELSEGLQNGGTARYRVAVETGLRKVLARMGISTISSYRNSYLFEIIGLDADVCAAYFPDATHVLGGKSLGDLLGDSLQRHAAAFADDVAVLPDAGLYRFRQGGERHSTSPELVRRMHRYIKTPDAENYRAYAELADKREPTAVRDLLEIVPNTPIAVEEVEDDSAILRRFSTQAMSLGSLGPEAHRTIAIAMNRLGARSNTGEGGEDPELYRTQPEAGNRVKQVASARFGVTTEYLVQAAELEIKMAQGSKPGEGGQLPATKVTPYIARLRHAVPGMGLISPPPHHDIYSIEDLAQLIYDLRSVNPLARIGVKLVSGAGVGVIAAGVAKAGADVITISGFDGGTGSSPLTSIKNTGLPWEVGLREAHRALVRTGFRSRVQLRVDGGFKSGRDVIVAALLGAQEFGFGTAALLAIGCIMARQCHLNTCPVGIATQDETLRARFSGNPEMVMTYFRGVAAEVRERLAALGARSLQEIIGSVERLRPRDAQATRALKKLLEPETLPATRIAELPGESSVIELDLGTKLAHAKSFPGSGSFTICNSDRSVGAHLSGELLRRAGNSAFKNTVTEHNKITDFEFQGSAGQSFGAFLISGLQFRLHGEANDYVGKGLSGGTIAITAGAEACRRGDVLAGNTVLYGATSGQLFIAGRAGERFAVRNSGALAVVEGVGQHGCEYMTAGVVIILGSVGINFGSGMTGGLTYIASEALSEHTYNKEFVRPAAIEEEEESWLRRVLSEHVHLTGSPRAEDLLNDRYPLPLVRLEPLHLPCAIDQTWSPTLARLHKTDLAPSRFLDALPPEVAPLSEQSAS